MGADKDIRGARVSAQGILHRAGFVGAETPEDETTDNVITGRFPRTAAVIEMAEMADRMRFAAASLEALASNTTAYDPATLRRAAATMVRELVGVLAGRVAL